VRGIGSRSTEKIFGVDIGYRCRADGCGGGLLGAQLTTVFKGATVRLHPSSMALLKTPSHSISTSKTSPGSRLIATLITSISCGTARR
jgi:hypothetical protein